MPTTFVPIDTSNYPHAVNRLLIDGGFSRFVYQYYLAHRATVDGCPASRFQFPFSTKELWNQFLKFGASDSVVASAFTAAQRLPAAAAQTWPGFAGEVRVLPGPQPGRSHDQKALETLSSGKNKKHPPTLGCFKFQPAVAMERTFLSLRIHFVFIPPFFLNPVRTEDPRPPPIAIRAK